MLDLTRNLDDVLETLHRAKRRGECATLVIGAGCSASAGIPLAADFIDLIEKEYPHAIEHATERTYDSYMRALAPSERHALINSQTQLARVNPAHLAIAHLLKQGFVSRVVTTNFDSLLPRACALTGEFPTVYSLPYASPPPMGELPNSALFYLQAQGAIGNKAPSRRLRAVLNTASQTQPWLVVGYSGTDRQLFPRLASHPHFDGRLYWVGHGEKLPAPVVQRRLLRPGKEAYWVPGFDADTFFVQLVRQLGVFSSDFADRLLEHPQSVLETLSPAAQPDQLLERLPHSSTPLPKEVHSHFSSSQLREADRLIERAQYKANHETDALFESAYALYAGAIALKSPPADIYLSWAMALSEQAKLKTGLEAGQLLGRACEKYELALQHTPGDPNLEYLWGLALSRRAQLTRGDDSRIFLQESQKHLKRAEEGRPGIAAYFLACLCGSCGDPNGVISWLERCKATDTLPARALVENNPALRPFLGDPWFTALYPD